MPAELIKLLNGLILCHLHPPRVILAVLHGKYPKIGFLMEHPGALGGRIAPGVTGKCRRCPSKRMNVVNPIAGAFGAQISLT